MINKSLKFLLLLVALVIILIPLATNSLFDLKQREDNEKVASILEAEMARIKAQKELEYKAYLTGKFDPAERKDFALISRAYSLGENKTYMRKEAYSAFVEMRKAAAKDGIVLNIASATRNFLYQKNLWENKWKGITLVDGGKLPETVPDGLARFEKILEYSAAPGTSRHHWGTDIDINDADQLYFETPKGAKEHSWLVENAPSFGFCQTYGKKTIRASGYNEEKWHWSYLPLAKDFTKDYASLIKEENITGFAGDMYVKNLDLINDYVLNINPECI